MMGLFKKLFGGKTKVTFSAKGSAGTYAEAPGESASDLKRVAPSYSGNLQEEKRPDYKNELERLIKAADLDDAVACETVGNMLCGGTGCRADVEKGVKYLEKAVANGRASAGKYNSLYCPNGKKLTDEEYESCLAEFVKAVDDEDDKAYELYATLKSGTQKQLARLGYVLITARNVWRAGYEPFKYSFTLSGIPLLPVASKRGLCRTFLRFNLDAWTDRHPLIAVASDILYVDKPEWLLKELHRARVVGRAEYKSPGFGWLGEEKKAVLIRLGDEYRLDADAMSEVIRACVFIDEEYQGDSIAFMADSMAKSGRRRFAEQDSAPPSFSMPIIASLKRRSARSAFE